jgi:hypothetical protein
MMPILDQIAVASENPPAIHIFSQRFGGKKKVEKTDGEYKKVGRGKAPGIIIYEEMTNAMSAGQLTTIKDYFIKESNGFPHPSRNGGVKPRICLFRSYENTIPRVCRLGRTRKEMKTVFSTKKDWAGGVVRSHQRF